VVGKKFASFSPSKFVKSLENILEVELPCEAPIRSTLSLVKKGVVGQLPVFGQVLKP